MKPIIGIDPRVEVLNQDPAKSGISSANHAKKAWSLTNKNYDRILMLTYGADWSGSTSFSIISIEFFWETTELIKVSAIVTVEKYFRVKFF